MPKKQMEVEEDFVEEVDETPDPAAVVERHRGVLVNLVQRLDETETEAKETLQWVIDNNLSKVGHRRILTAEERKALQKEHAERNKVLRAQREEARARTQATLVRAVRHPVIGEPLREFNMPTVVAWFHPDNGYVQEDGTIQIWFDNEGFVRPRAIETEKVNGVPMSAMLAMHAEATSVIERVSRNRRWQLMDVGDFDMEELQFD